MLFAKLAPTLLFLLLPTSLYATEDVEMGEASAHHPSAPSPLMTSLMYSCVIREYVSPFSAFDLLLRHPREITPLFQEIQSKSGSRSYHNLDACLRYLEQEAINLPYYAAFIGNSRFQGPDAAKLKKLGNSLQRLLTALRAQAPSSAVDGQVDDLEHDMKHYWEKTTETQIADNALWKWSEQVSRHIEKEDPMLGSLYLHVSPLARQQPRQQPRQKPREQPRQQPINSCIAEAFFLTKYPPTSGKQTTRMNCLDNHISKGIALISSAKPQALKNSGQSSIPFTLMEIRKFLMDYIKTGKTGKIDVSHCMEAKSKCSKWYTHVKNFAKEMAFPSEEEDYLVLASALTHLSNQSKRAVESINTYRFVPTCSPYRMEDHLRLIYNLLRWLRLRVWGKDELHSPMDKMLLQKAHFLLDELSRVIGSDSLRKADISFIPGVSELNKEHRATTAKLYSHLAKLTQWDPFTPDIMSDNVLKRRLKGSLIRDDGPIEDVDELSLSQSLLLLTGSGLSAPDEESIQVNRFKLFFQSLLQISHFLSLSNVNLQLNSNGDPSPKGIRFRFTHINNAILEDSAVHNLYNRVDFALRWIHSPSMSSRMSSMKMTTDQESLNFSTPPDSAYEEV
ncbi:MAG: hypothetical protein DHS80DRAFT_21708 [Piptocephalis tieghemiana]|nr:MAG: hypothetical protein DHS80DRAFT_21708 [Piptocephalis tieghemiana]